jgi:trk system potassium uptake protein TrkH
MRRRPFSPPQLLSIHILGLILIGTALLSLPIAAHGRPLSLVNALFTSTSAVCVTGLIVVDTATVFTLWGRIILLALIQIGGLGIMILSYFAAFSLRRSLSVEDKMLISYMLNENDARNLQSSLRRIVLITVSIEAVGAALLLTRFSGRLGDRLLFSAFHAISAFCNAGFALFTDSLAGYRSDLVVNLVVAGLIIAGGISFGVLTNALHVLTGRRDGDGRPEKLSLNSRVVLLATAVLIVGGMLLIYLLEHANALRSLDLGTQYLSAFFQSVTLRTAGFNTLAMGQMRPATLLVMMVFMFIGAAAGSTAGGIKVNSVAVIGAYLRAVLRDRQDVVLFRYFIAPEIVTKALMVFVFGITAVSTGAIVLSITEHAPVERLLFEVVSAFGTVGLSAGVTPHLSAVGKLVIVALMFAGRIGPLTLLAAAARQTRRVRIQYPTGNVVIG